MKKHFFKRLTIILILVAFFGCIPKNNLKKSLNGGSMSSTEITGQVIDQSTVDQVKQLIGEVEPGTDVTIDATSAMKITISRQKEE